MVKKANLFLVGAAKCGTSALHDYLKQHPDIFMTNDKETFYFAPELRSPNNAYRSRKVYDQAYKGWKKEKYGGESTPLYLYSEQAPKLIHTYNPEAKILIIIREPSDYLQALHLQLLNTSQENIKELGKALAVEQMRKKGKLIPAGVNPLRIYYKERSSFTKQILRYQKLFGKKKVKIIIYDDFKKNNMKTYKDVLTFLGVDESFVPKAKIINPRSKYRSLLIKNVLESKLVWTIPKKILPYSTYAKLKQTYRFVTFKAVKKKNINPQLLKHIKKTYYQEVKKLSKLTGRNLLQEWRYEGFK